MLRRYNAKYSKSADRSVVVEKAQENKANDYASLSTEELQNITNADLKAYLDAQSIEYASGATKKDLIELVAGK